VRARLHAAAAARSRSAASSSLSTTAAAATAVGGTTRICDDWLDEFEQYLRDGSLRSDGVGTAGSSWAVTGDEGDIGVGTARAKTTVIEGPALFRRAVRRVRAPG
jgi:hypothetical protein